MAHSRNSSGSASAIAASSSIADSIAKTFKCAPTEPREEARRAEIHIAAEARPLSVRSAGDGKFPRSDAAGHIQFNFDQLLTLQLR
jgi:hypothetical protein